MRPRNNSKKDDQSQKTCWSVLNSVLSKVSVKHLFIWSLLALSGQQVLAEPTAAKSDEETVSVTTYMRGKGHARLFNATRDDVVQPAKAHDAYCLLTVSRTTDKTFNIGQMCGSANISPNNVATGAYAGVYTGQRFVRGTLARQAQREDGARVISNVEFSHPNAVTETRTVIKPAHGGPSVEETTKAIYMEANGDGILTATMADVVRPASECLLQIEPEKGMITNKSNFAVLHLCKAPTQPHACVTAAGNFFVGNELDRGKVKQTLNPEQTAVLDFTRGDNTATETITTRRKP
jgi:hypothetical protein